MLLHVTKLLIPGLVEYFAKMAPFVHEGLIPEAQVAALREVWKAFSVFFTSIPEPYRKSASFDERAIQVFVF